MADEQRTIEQLYAAALKAGFVLTRGRAHFKTSNGVPMRMPVKAERIVRKAMWAMYGKELERKP